MAEFSGIRERKKVRTREALIEAAAELCLRQGFDNTTVEQIALAADVSTRTFSRYFSTKESVITAMTGDMDRYLAKALEQQRTDITEYEALMRAHLHIFQPDLPYQTPASKRMALLIQIINNTESLRSSSWATGWASRRPTPPCGWSPTRGPSSLRTPSPDWGRRGTTRWNHACSATDSRRSTTCSAGRGCHGRVNRTPRVNPPQARRVESDYLPLVMDSLVSVDKRRRG